MSLKTSQQLYSKANLKTVWFSDCLFSSLQDWNRSSSRLGSLYRYSSSCFIAYSLRLQSLWNITKQSNRISFIKCVRLWVSEWVCDPVALSHSWLMMPLGLKQWKHTLQLNYDYSHTYVMQVVHSRSSKKHSESHLFQTPALTVTPVFLKKDGSFTAFLCSTFSFGKCTTFML